MTKKITFKNSKVLGYLLILLGLFGSSAYNLSQAQAPYCSAPSSYSPCSGLNMYIGTVRVAQGSNVIFNKANDGCNTTSGGYTLMSTTPSFTLNGGSNYTMSFNTGPNYAVNIGVWVDLNRDNDFTDAGEYLSTGWAQINNGVTNIQSRNAYVSCNGISAGTSRMRIRSEYSYNSLTSGSSCATITYGETEDYTITLATSTSLAAGFFMPASAFTGTPVKMTNSNQTGYVGHQWDVGDNGSIEYTTTDATHIFPSAGTQCVRLKSQNCLGRDSILKCINIADPTAAPVVDFASNSNEVEKFGSVKFLDLSINGPTYWSWYMYDPTDSAASRATVENDNYGLLVGNDPYKNSNPDIFFSRTGTYTVCLQTSNLKGPSKELCKKNYVRVTPFKDNNLGAGTVQPIYEASGNIIDDGGRNGNYSNNRIDYATIIPCGAKKITLTFKQFKVLAGDELKIYDGTNAAGTPLHPGTGFTAGTSPIGKQIVATSGAMYIYFSTNGTGNDSGFIASWVTEKGITNPPIASFTVPDTLYNPIEYTYTNTSQNVLGKTDFVWSIEPGYGEVGYAPNLDYAILTDNTYDVKLDATTCVGRDDFTKSVVVVTPHTKAEVDFKANTRRPTTGETVTITPFCPLANKAIKADNFKWSFFPSNVTIVGQDEYGVIQVKFNAKGKYTVSVRAWNSLDSTNTTVNIIKSDYVIVVEHCTPLLGVASSTDIAINNVKLTTSTNVTLIDNTSANNIQGYNDYTNVSSLSANLDYGSTYTISTSRNTNVNPMSRKVWIDWNIDGDFDDANEEVASEATATTASFTANFTVPNNIIAFEGKTRMRIGTSYSTDPNKPCGASSGIANANRIGEFEDYRVFITNDNKPPVLTLNNDDTLYLEVGSTYTEYGATAIDPTEGNISSSIVITSDVDMAYTGVYYLQYNVKDAGGNIAIPVNRVVYVVKDQTKPVLTLNGSDTVYVEVFGTYTEDGAKATDNKDGNLDNAIVVTGSVKTSILGTYVLTYTVNDVAGNQASKNRIVIVRDSQKPVISNSDADANKEIKVQIVTIFVDRTTVSDNYSNPTLMVTPGSSGPVDTRFKGTYPMLYDATDISGNKATTVTYKYIVDDYVGPVINLNTLDTIVWPVNKAYTSVQASTSDNFYDNSQISITRTSNVNPYKLGMYSDVYTATDGSGNVTVRTRYIRVVDNDAPVIKGSAMNVGLFSTVNAAEGLTITDNYDAPTALMPRLVVLSNNLNTYAEGLYSVTFQVTDLSGNLSAPYERNIWVSRMFPTIQGSVASIGKDKTVNVYPNPSNGLVNISYNFATPETMNVKVYNATGSLVAEINSIHGQNGVQSIDLSAQANGLYHVSMTVAGKQINRTISLNK
jgi:PKD repeat protein